MSDLSDEILRELSAAEDGLVQWMHENGIQPTETRNESEMKRNANGLGLVQVKKKQLLEQLRSNLVDHQEKYEKALEAYWEKVRAAIEKIRDGANEILNDFENSKTSNLDYYGLKSLEKPRCYSSMYLRVIKQVEWGHFPEGLVSLTDSEFERYVLDNWTWSNDFNTTVQTYTSK